jgi:CubicO group peptidase (beta-lactamase class C family)
MRRNGKNVRQRKLGTVRKVSVRKGLRLRMIAFLLAASVGNVASSAEAAETPKAYFPPPESNGGWRVATDPEEVRRLAGMDLKKLDEAWDYVKSLDDNSSLLVVRHGWLCYERYQGGVTPTSNEDMHSCGKAFTGVAVAVLMNEKPDLFPERLDQLVYDPKYLPKEAFPLTDPRKAEIKLGQLLSHTSGIRGNNPCYGPDGKLTIEPAGPDGSFPDNVAFGKADWGGTSAKTLWTKPGGGYSYASGGVLILGATVRHLSGKEVADYLGERVFAPIGWEGWKWYDNPPEPDASRHTKAQGGIQPRPRDALRFGYLLLHLGKWKDKQIIPEWYAEAMRKPSPYNPYYSGYGFLVVVNPGQERMPSAPADTYGASGAANNHIFVVPSLDMVVVRIDGTDRTSESFNSVQDKIIGAVIRAVVP